LGLNLSEGLGLALRLKLIDESGRLRVLSDLHVGVWREKACPESEPLDVVFAYAYSPAASMRSEHRNGCGSAIAFGLHVLYNVELYKFKHTRLNFS
jgi:hypothetical protein